MAIVINNANSPRRVVIAGAGLAGSCAAIALSTSFDVTLIDAGSLVPGASWVGAGLVNPLLGRQGRRVWRADEALAALEKNIALANAEQMVTRRPVVRPAADTKQQRRFREAAAASPELGTWLEPGEVRDLYPFVNAPLGALSVRGAAVDIDQFCRAVQRAAAGRGATMYRESVVESWSTSDGAGCETVVRTTAGRRTISSDLLLLCAGAATPKLTKGADLNLHLLKGQTLIAELPVELAANQRDGASLWPHLSGSGYVAVQSDHLVLGSTYEHDFQTIDPTPAATAEILSRVVPLSRVLDQLTIREARAGVRVTVPRSYLPMVGPLPGAPSVWVFTGLGSKGLLMAPMLARELAGYLAGSSAIPEEIRPR